MITAIICSLFLGFIVGAIVISCSNTDPFPFDPVYFEREKRLRAEADAMELYRRLENQRIDNIRLSNYPLYQVRNPLLFEIQKLPRVQSPEEAGQKYGEHWKVTDAIIGKLNEVISEVNNPSIKKM